MMINDAGTKSIWTSVGRVTKHLLYVLFPRRCMFCDCAIKSTAVSCAQCESIVETVEEKICPLCGRGKKRCTCRGRRNHYKAIVAPFYYSGVVKQCLHRFKFMGRRELAESIAAEMEQTVRKRFADASIDLVTCVPMRQQSIRDRGYNQSALLCSEIARGLNLPCDDTLLTKLYDTPAQHGLSALMRSGNIFGVFDVSHPEAVEGKTLLLCDDIMTTGATLKECSKMLLLSGASEVYCVTAAVGDRQSDDERNDT